MISYTWIYFTLFIVIAGNISSHSQNIEKLYSINTHVGDTIDKAEKQKYYLFPFFHDDLYLYSTIYARNDSSFRLRTKFIDSTSVDSIVSKNFINTCIDNIETMETYYRNILNQKVELITAKYYKETPEKVRIIEDTKKKRKFKLEIPLSLNTNEVLFPEEVKEVLSVMGRPGYDYGIGVKLDWKYKIKPRIGLKQWTKSIGANYSILNNEYNIIKIREMGRINYSGFYAKLNYEGQYFLCGLGLNYSLNNWYLCDRTIFNSDGEKLSEEKNKKYTYFTEDFNEQYELGVYGGGKIYLNSSLAFSILFEMSYIDNYLFPSIVYYYQGSFPFQEKVKADYESFMFRISLITEISFYKEGKKRVSVTY